MDYLDKEKVKVKLIDSSLYLMAYHLLKLSIIQGVKDFFLEGYDGKEYIISPDYKNKVLSKSRYEMEACLIFLEENGAITKTDIEAIHSLREYRNNLAHDIPSSIYVKDKQVDFKRIQEAGLLLDKIDRFWGGVEVDTDPDINPEDVDFDGIKSMRSLIFDHIVEIVKEDQSNT